MDATPPSPPAPAREATPVIAVVDDDQGIRTALHSLLRSVGYRVRVFADAPSFLAEAARERPDCLVTDIQMPGMGGLELQRAVRARYPGLPVIIITAFPEEAIREQALADGALHFFAKPFETAAMLRCLADAVGSAG
ncbi:response regulator [Roseomonas sp. GC11]|uniref:response regulator transcription factor n=1 Tax=Roseomonas sp. GC11 TaxID=2950546 RepID=UPI002109184F|nr:response regulator [Roseomonas sp. GC11]MCQ4160779.1 response regulator [Roseomonas sp. GC11]